MSEIKIKLTSGEAVVVLNAISQFEESHQLSSGLASEILLDYCKKIRHKFFYKESSEVKEKPEVKSVFVLNFRPDEHSGFEIIGLFTTKEKALKAMQLRAERESILFKHKIEIEESKSKYPFSNEYSDWVTCTVGDYTWEVSEEKIVE